MLWFNRGGDGLQSDGVHGMRSDPTGSKYFSANNSSIGFVSGLGRALNAVTTTLGSTFSGLSTNAFESLPKM